MGTRHVIPEDDQLEGLLPIHFASQTDTEEESGGDAGGVLHLFSHSHHCVHPAMLQQVVRVYLAAKKSKPDKVESEIGSQWGGAPEANRETKLAAVMAKMTSTNLADRFFLFILSDGAGRWTPCFYTSAMSKP